MSDNLSSYMKQNVFVKGSLKDGIQPSGYSKDQIREELETVQKNSVALEKRNQKALNRIFGFKELFDRLAYGVAPIQFITILFFLLGASPFIVGTVNAIRDVFTGLLSSFISEYSKRHFLSKSFISISGIIFGFSFLLIVLGFRLQSIPLYAFAMIIGSLSVVAYGSLYLKFYDKQLSYERRSTFLKNITHFGLLITLVAFIAAGIVFEVMGLEETIVSFFGLSFPISGYFVMFEVAAVLFILSGYVLSFVKEEKPLTLKYPFFYFVKEYTHQLSHEYKILTSSAPIRLLLTGSLIINVLQSLGASFYGYYVYTLFSNQLFGGFINVAIVFSVAILFSFLGPALTKYLQNHIGFAPMFVFGALLCAIMPLVLVYNPYFNAVVAASGLMVLGASILGVAQGLLARKLLSESQRSTFFHTLTIFLSLPFLILVPIGAYIAQTYSFSTLFLAMAFSFIFILVPIYLRLVFLTHKQRL